MCWPILILPLLALGAPASPKVVLPTGVLEGAHFGSGRNGGEAFLGIPYAAPPVGDLRWKPPQPPAPWTGTREATEFGSSCPQLPAGWLPQMAWNEDCLYLNVWTPRLSASAKLPVMVWIHGGSNTAGRSQQDPLGPAFSSLGVVVVSLNYRLGPFGFLAHPVLTAESEHRSSGNYGLLDQLQALRWVHDDISRFGGDPARVTLAGQSAGAVDACLLMTSPMAAGLFQRAIMQSGECQSTLNKDLRTEEESGERLARDLGEFQKLRSASAADILSAWSGDPSLDFEAIVDGWIVPRQPATIFAEGRQLHVPVIVGSNADEATVFAQSVKTVGEYKAYLREDTGEYASQELEAYPVASDADVPVRYLQLQNDEFEYGAYSLAKATEQAGQNAYLYYFSYADTGSRSGLGAHHGEELMFLSNVFRSDWVRSRDSEALAAAMRTYWTQFIRTGNPGWPAFDSRTDQCMELGHTIRVRDIPRLAQIRILEHINQQIIHARR
jgi:para-nitrobenzyl esterase